MPGSDVFISYTREDRDVARLFAESFEQEGFSVWWDAVLHSGETFDEVIETALKAAKAVVVLWSPRSVASRWVRAEATLADRRRTLAPVIIEECDRPIIFELTHTTDLSHWEGEVTDRTWRGFVRDLHRLVDQAPAGGAPAASEPVGLRAAAARRAERAADVVPLRHPAPARAAFAQPVARFAPVRAAAPQPARSTWGARNALADIDEGEHTQTFTRPETFAELEDEQFHCLEMMVGERMEKRFVVSPLGLRIGRSAPADIILQDNRVSRQHCRIELADDRLRVRDLGSTNGTYIDGYRIEGEAMLAVGSVLRIGSVCFRHEVRNQDEV
ncbi:TIR domain-containing protein [Sphingomonas ginkgonis]|uniref:TIR domain-containing protein n=1 Tax=Sphingomonas ginkgonis TaxID=2315330 RepID=A0A3R9YK70_9SPHN|nr:TIR domain-containing protein [Sphingomonas ginkgonis]RST31729.1 TIR domain-containing protein [Sphingomonas ginkgonis]